MGQHGSQALLPHHRECDALCLKLLNTSEKTASGYLADFPQLIRHKALHYRDVKFFNYIVLTLYAHTPVSATVGVWQLEDDLWDFGFFPFQSCGSSGLNSGCQAWPQAPLPISLAAENRELFPGPPASPS